MNKILLLLAGCAIDGGDRIYACTATFYCDNSPYQITESRACVSDDDEALVLWQKRLDEITADAQCVEKRFEPECVDTGRACIAD